MRKLLLIMAGSILVLCFNSVALAQNAPASAYGYTADEIAENQGAVAYWYAWGYKYAFGQLPASFAQMKEHGLPLRGFFSPHTQTEINFDDGSLDFDGDMTYSITGASPVIRIQTTKGVVVLPGTLTRTDECGIAHCCDISICQDACWKVCDDNHAACAIVQWMMWKSFETHQCRYGYRPADEQAWMASGFSPIEPDWRTRYPYMNIKLIYGKCELKKARVTCCAPCPTCTPCAVAKPCGQCDKCKPKCDTGCKPKCESKCNTCAVVPVARPACGKCQAKSKCNTCAKAPAVKPACDSCNKCKPKCENKCNSCAKAPVIKPACDSCNKCKPKCENKCGQCQSKTYTGCGTCAATSLYDIGYTSSSVQSGSRYNPAAGTSASPNQCGCDAWVPYSGSELVESLRISITATEGTTGGMKLLLRNPLLQQVVLIDLPGPITNDYTYTYSFGTPVKASDLFEAVLINEGDDPATLTSLRVVGVGEGSFNYMFVEHTCPGALVGIGGCPRMEIY